MLRWPGLEEGDLRPRARPRDDRPDVEALTGQERPDVIPVPVVADGRYHGRSDPQPGQARADVPGEPADGSDECVRGSQARAGRGRREVDADPADDDRLDHRRTPTVTPGA